MTGYDILLFLHIVGAIVWLGGGTMVGIFIARAQRAGGDRLRGTLEDAAWLGGRFFAPVGLVVGLLGVWMVATSAAWTFGQFWVIFGLLGYLASAAWGGAVLAKLSRRAVESFDRDGADAPETRDLVRRLGLAGRVDQVILLAVVFDMVVKPGA